MSEMYTVRNVSEKTRKLIDDYAKEYDLTIAQALQQLVEYGTEYAEQHRKNSKKYLNSQEALKQIPREKVIIATKFSDTSEKNVDQKIKETVKALKTDYLDICLLHGVRNAFEIKMRSGALKALIKAKEKGYVRSIGLSAHGIGAIEASLTIPEIEVLLARINWSGVSMDAYQEGFLSKLVAIPYVKEVARKIIPKKLIPSFSAQVE